MPDLRPDPLARALRAAADRVPPLTLDEVLARRAPDLPAPGDWTDPVDDEPAAGTANHTGGTPMVIELEDRRTDPHDPSRPAGAPSGDGRWRRIVLAAAAVVVVVGGIGIAVLGGGDETSVEVAPVDQPQPRPAAGEDDPEVVFDRFIAAVNSGDEEAMVPFEEGRLVNVFLFDPSYLAAGDRWTRTGPCQPDGDDGVLCPVQRRDDLHGAGGLVLDMQVALAVSGDGRLEQLIARGDDPYRAYVEFRSAFREWVEANHADAGIRFYPSEPSGTADLADMPFPQDMGDALDLVDDFVAQSEVYPVG